MLVIMINLIPILNEEWFYVNFLTIHLRLFTRKNKKKVTSLSVKKSFDRL